MRLNFLANFFFFNDTATTEIYTLSLHDALPICAVGGGIAAQEGEGDGRIDVGEDRRGPGPEAVQQRPELIGEGDARSDQIVAAAHESAERARRVGQGLKRAEAMASGTEPIARDYGIARITRTARGGVAGTARLQGVGVDGNDQIGRASCRERV